MRHMTRILNTHGRIYRKVSSSGKRQQQKKDTCCLLLTGNNSKKMVILFHLSEKSNNFADIINNCDRLPKFFMPDIKKMIFCQSGTNS